MTCLNARKVSVNISLITNLLVNFIRRDFEWVELQVTDERS